MRTWNQDINHGGKQFYSIKSKKMINKLAYNQIEKSFGPEIFYTHSLQYLELIYAYGEKSVSLGLQNDFFKLFNPMTRLGSKAKLKKFSNRCSWTLVQNPIQIFS